MTTVLYAQPYDRSAIGFYFKSAEEFAAKSLALKNAHGDPVEEFEIQFIDGEDVDAALVGAVNLHQHNLEAFFEKIDAWDDADKQTIAIAAGECGYDFTWEKSEPGDFDVDLYRVDSLPELAEMLVDDGLFGDIPERLQFYLDYDAIARDLSAEYVETEVAGERFVYRCG